MEENNLTSHEKRELKEKQREQEKADSEKKKSNEKLRKNIFKWGVTIIIFALIIFSIYNFVFKPLKDFKPVHSEAYHWHANFKVSVCGEQVQIKCGAGMCGPMNLHHHNDNTIHIEGSVIAKEKDISLGKFFEGLRLDFSETSLLKKKNGDLCPNGSSGTVKMYVNGQQNNEFENYILKKCDSQNIKQDCDNIEIKFE